MTNPLPLSRYVIPELSEDRLAAQWGGSLAVARQRQRGQRAQLAAAAATLLCLGLVVTGLVWRSPEATPEMAALAAGMVIESEPGRPQRLVLPDATQVEIAAATRLSIVELSGQRVRLRLDHGGVTVDAVRRPERQLVVEAERTEVIVVGTRFSVSVYEDAGVPRVAVAVDRGEVRVRPPDGAAETLLRAGESWGERPVPAAPQAPAPFASVGVPPAAPSAALPPPSSTPAADWRSLRRSDPKVAYRVLGEEGFARTLAGGDAAELFELYEVAKLNGRMHDAVSALERLRQRFPGNARAGLAAFEVGRLRQDHLGDPAGAATALEDAVRRGGAFGEDATARLARAYHTLGDRARCQRARDRYLTSYPRGAHVELVKGLCGS